MSAGGLYSTNCHNLLERYYCATPYLELNKIWVSLENRREILARVMVEYVLMS